MAAVGAPKGRPAAVRVGPWVLPWAPSERRLPRRHARPHRIRWSLAAWFLLVSVAVGWWVCLAPPQLGGGTAYVIVSGTSMEPLLHSGDLAVARQRSAYHPGDLVVFTVGTGQVIHRIIEGTAADGWVTRGDNNAWIDPWLLPDSDIVGEYAGGIPGAGGAMVWLLGHPLALGVVAALAIALSYAPHHRRDPHPTLVVALRNAVPEPRAAGRPAVDRAVLAASIAATTATYVVSLLAFLRQDWRIPNLCAVAALAVSGAITVWLLYRLYDGVGLDQVTQARYALSGCSYRVAELPPVPHCESVGSAAALRGLAERFRIPVLHHVDPGSGRHTYLALTSSHGDYVYETPLHPAPPDHSGAHWTHVVEEVLTPGHRPAHEHGHGRDRAWHAGRTAAADPAATARNVAGAHQAPAQEHARR